MEMSLGRLIHQRMQELGIGRGDLARRMGYAKFAKGCRRIDQICGGHLGMAGNLRIALSAGLKVDIEVVDKAIDVTRAQQIAAEDKVYRESFKPHAVILTKQQVPSQITLYAMTGGSRHRIIPFKEGSSPKTYAAQAREALPNVVPFFGRPTGYVVNCTPDFALAFNKEGRMVGRLDRAFRVGQSAVIVRGKKVGEKVWSGLWGT